MNRQTPNDQVSPFEVTTTSLQTSSISAKTSSWSDGRLIVLVPDDLTYGDTTRRIWEVAVATGRPVQLLSLCKDMTQELSLHRQLVTLSALIAESRVPTEAKVEIGRNWLDALKRNYQAGDIIVCFAEEHTGFLQRPLKKVLESELDAPVYILFCLYPRKQARSKVLSLILFWIGIVSIIAGAMLLQIRILSLSREWAPIILMILAVVVEFWLIWVWNKLFS